MHASACIQGACKCLTSAQSYQQLNRISQCKHHPHTVQRHPVQPFYIPYCRLPWCEELGHARCRKIAGCQWQQSCSVDMPVWEGILQLITLEQSCFYIYHTFLEQKAQELWCSISMHSCNEAERDREANHCFPGMGSICYLHTFVWQRPIDESCVQETRAWATHNLWTKICKMLIYRLHLTL